MTTSCKQCERAFDITERDQRFYDLVSPTFAGRRFTVPVPTLCPDCRQQRRLAWRNERTLYRRQCDRTGKPIVSIYAPNFGYQVYDRDEWYSDRWDALSYGREFDFNKPFFEQFSELQKVVPMLALNQQAGNENCDYTNLVSYNKNCYYIFAGNSNEDCYYCTYVQRNRDVVDCFLTFDSTRCYDCVDCYNCYELLHSQNCLNCNTGAHLYNCRGNNNCFACISLMNKSYCIFNKQYTREQYQLELERIKSRADSAAYVETQLALLLRSSPQKYYTGFSNEGVIGNHVTNSKNSEYCFDCTYLEDCSYCVWLHRAVNCYDCYAYGLKGELGYENHLCGNNFYNLQYCDSCWNDVSNLLYCRYCVFGSKNLFGCIGLRGKEYCVLNKQYSKAEYESLVSRVITHMQHTGEWGEFFPVNISPFAYNETVAQEYFPLSDTEVHDQSWRWKEDLPHTVGRETLSWQQIPKNIQEIPDSITEAILACRSCAKNYKVIAPELKFYRSMGISIPQHCFDCRYRSRFVRRNPRKLYSRHCEKCGESLLSTFSLERPELVYCEKCYLEDIG